LFKETNIKLFCFS